MRASPRILGGLLLCSIASALSASSALAAVPHTVLPGESLWSISAANNLTTRTVAAYNGMSENGLLLAGTVLQVPTVEEGAAALGATAVSAPRPAPGMGVVPSPYGNLQLAPAAADAWNAMRAEALSAYGVDLYPGGPLSAYRTPQQQAGLYSSFLAGAGAPANPPGSSSHELGTAVDVPTLEMRHVIDEIGWRHGWSKVHAPGEWWHVDYVG
jgi:LysM repeat protein